MQVLRILLISGLSAMLCSSGLAAGYADEVVGYEPGTGATAGYDSPDSALGEPSRVTPGAFGGPVNPFNPPYLPEQLVSIGAGGSLTVRFDSPIIDSPGHLFGLDFIIFGNNGFTIVNGDFSGGGITDGSTFTFDPPGASAVFVSEDNLTFFELVPPAGMSARVDGLFPTDGAGDFFVPVDPAMTGADFDGAGLAEISDLYGLSGGGTGFDLAWAMAADGQPASISGASYVRVDVLTGKVELDGFAVVPEPGTGALAAMGLALLGGVCWRGRRRVDVVHNADRTGDGCDR